MTAHYFVIRPHRGTDPRPCGKCGMGYDTGEHIEITTLKPYTRYVCPDSVGTGYGHSSRSTGAYRPSWRTLRDHICICGTALVEEDTEEWRLSWEMIGYYADDRRQVSKTGNRHDTHAQRDGLLQLIQQGEAIRNVTLKRLR